MQEDTGAARRGRGKPRKSQEILAGMVLVHAPEMAGKPLFMSTDAMARLIEEEGYVAKLDRISDIIGLRFGIVASAAEIVQDSENAGIGGPEGLTGVRSTLRPWLDGKSPVNTFSDAERARHANSRVLDTLVRHLVEHVVIDEELRGIAADARRRAEDELRDVPLSMIDFINRLMASGVVVRDVRDMPKSRLAKVVSIIRGLDTDDALNEIPDNLPASTWSDAGIGSPTIASDGDAGIGSPTVASDGDAKSLQMGSDGLIAERVLVSGSSTQSAPGDLVSQPAEGIVEPALNEASDGLAPAVPAGLAPAVPAVEPPVEDALLESKSGPRDMWDDIDLSRTGYRIEEHAIASDEDAVLVQMQLPPDLPMIELALPNGPEEVLAVASIARDDLSLAQRFVGLLCSRKELLLTEQECRLWLFLLFELRTVSKGIDVGRDGFYDGVRLPETVGSSRVRRLVAIDRNHLLRAVSKTRLAEPAEQLI